MGSSVMSLCTEIPDVTDIYIYIYYIVLYMTNVMDKKMMKKTTALSIQHMKRQK